MKNSAPSERPRNALKKAVSGFARERGITVDRATRYIAYHAFFGLLARAHSESILPIYFVKGGVALELRLGSRARASKDVDIGLVAPPEHLLPTMMRAIALGWDEFVFAIKRHDVTPNGTLRLLIQVSYCKTAWSTIKVDLTNADDATAVEFQEGFALSQIGLPSTPLVPCINALDQIAQKIHAVTGPYAKDRFRDVVDLMLLAPLVEGRWADLNNACADLFAARATHAWPPTLNAPPEWIAAINGMLDDLGSPTRADEAVLHFHTLIYRICHPEKDSMKAEYRYLLLPTTAFTEQATPPQVVDLGAAGFRQIDVVALSTASGPRSFFLVFERLTVDDVLQAQSARSLPRLHMRLTTENAGADSSNRILVGTIRNVGGSVANRVRIVVGGAKDIPKLGMIAPGDEPIRVNIPYPATPELAHGGLLGVAVQYADDNRNKLQQNGALVRLPFDNYGCDGIEPPIAINEFSDAYAMGEG